MELRTVEEIIDYVRGDKAEYSSAKVDGFLDSFCEFVRWQAMLGLEEEPPRTVGMRLTGDRAEAVEE